VKEKKFRQAHNFGEQTKIFLGEKHKAKFEGKKGSGKGNSDYEGSKFLESLFLGRGRRKRKQQETFEENV
jgi:hypothetical protein